MSRLTTAFACSLLLAWGAYPAGIAGAQETGDTQQGGQTATNTQTSTEAQAATEADTETAAQLPEPQSRQQSTAREQQTRTQTESGQPRQPSDRASRTQQFDQAVDQQFQTRSNQQFDRDQQMDQRSRQQLDAQGRVRQRMNGSRQGQADARQQLNFGAEFSTSQDDLTVSTINRGTLAAEIGLQENDQIVSVGGRTITSADQLNDVLVRTQSFQEPVPIVVRRGGSPTTLFLEPQVLRETFVVPQQAVDPGLGFVLVPRNNRIIVREVTGGLGDIIGLRENDVIVSVAGRSVMSRDQFADLLYSADADQIPIIVVRDGRREVLFVRQDELNFRMGGDADFYVAQDAWLGVVLDPREPDAAIVRRVIANSPAEDAGVRPGDQIVRLNGRAVTSPDHLTWLVDAMEPGEEVELDVSRRVSGTLLARLEGQAASPPRQAFRPTYDVEEPGIEVRQRRFYRGEIVDDFDADPDRGVIRDRFGPAERGLRDRLDRDEVPDEPRGLFPRR